MRQMASSYYDTPSSDQYFYADSYQSGTGIDTSCNSSENNQVTDLSSIFLSIKSSLSNSRLVPNSLASN
jgi:hypothetical protein